MQNILIKMSGFLWGLPLIVVLLGVGLYFSVGSRFFQFRKFGTIMKHTLGQIFKKNNNQEKGILTPVQAVSIALAGSIGVGNIAGVASAIALGGPGAVFWMWIAALFGMINKMVEVTLAVHYRDENVDGTTFGGPTYYMEKGLGKEKGISWWRVPAVIFSIGIFISLFITLQSYTVAEAIQTTFEIPMLVTGFVYMILMYLVLFGGIKRIGKMAEIVVPIMTTFFLLGGLVVIFKNISNLIPSFGLIFKSAFTPMSAVGGFGGVTVIAALRTGFARSVYSNEAGWGTAPMAHATAKTDHPISQGMWGSFEVFVDTILVCTFTALVIIITGEWSSGLSGANLTLTAFENAFGFGGRVFLAIGIFIFGWTTSTGWWTYGETILRHLLRDKDQSRERTLKIIRLIYPIPPFLMIIFAVSTGLPPKIIWLFADVITALPTFVNVITIFLLSGTFFKLLRDYESKELKYSKVKNKEISK